MINEDFSQRSKIKDVGRWYITRFVQEVASHLPIQSMILDAGAGEGVYKRMFSHCHYKAIDLAVGDSEWDYSHLDYVGMLHDMPIEDGIFDAVLCTQVLEHLEWPRESVQEMHRVLKPGGKLFMTVPMAQNEHQTPYDFFRYTSYGLTSICKGAGFQQVSIKPFGGMWVRWAYELPRGMAVFPPLRRNGKLNWSGVLWLPVKALALMFIRALQVSFLWLDRFDHEKNDPLGWSCEATK
ncbi:class I SAM-dependent methyltransferase [Aquabacterium sp.]|uniref:class I SAM-dependent methyltransferase n=1 Tax=Aquabacterium sp. TaxID=1872578 RepID=UPI003D6CF6FA